MSPAPWKLSEADPDGLTIVSRDSTALIAQFHGTVGLEQNQANARLGVLAPEMLEALRDLADRLDRDVPKHACPGFDCATCARPNTETARALIAKIDR